MKRLSGSASTPPVLVVENQTVPDIIALIKYKHKKCAADYDKIADYFWTGDIYTTCEDLFDFCKKYIHYRVENEDIQTVSSPSTILSKGFGDCKHYSLFIGGCLDALKRQGRKIDWCYRFASYSILDETPGHVFVVVKDGENEIWVDPVLDQFDYHRPFMYAMDKKVSLSGVGALGSVTPFPMVTIGPGLSRMKGHEVVGATGQQTGQAIMKITASVSPVLVSIPVAGWAIIGAGELTGFFLSVFGSKFTSSSGVRWLEQMFDYYVRGMASVTSDNKVPGTTQDIQAAQDWFAYVLGVPIYDKYRWHALRGENGDTGASLGISQDQAVKNYLAFPDVQQAGVPYNLALQASNIALSMPYHSGDAPGLWAGMLAAPSVIQGQAAAAGGGDPIANFALQLGIPEWVLLAGGGILIYLLFFNKK